MSFERIDPYDIDKVWGRERHIVKVIPPGSHDAGYTGKVLTLDQGFQSSIHFHVEKTETFLVVRGVVHLEIYDFIKRPKRLEPKHLSRKYLKFRTVLQLNEREGVTLYPYTPHRFWTECKKGAEFIEFSTPDHPDDSYRITRSGPRS